MAEEEKVNKTPIHDSNETHPSETYPSETHQVSLDPRKNTWRDYDFVRDKLCLYKQDFVDHNIRTAISHMAECVTPIIIEYVTTYYIFIDDKNGKRNAIALWDIPVGFSECDRCIPINIATVMQQWFEPSLSTSTIYLVHAFDLTKKKILQFDKKQTSDTRHLYVSDSIHFGSIDDSTLTIDQINHSRSLRITMFGILPIIQPSIDVSRTDLV